MQRSPRESPTRHSVPPEKVRILDVDERLRGERAIGPMSLHPLVAASAVVVTSRARILSNDSLSLPAPEGSPCEDVARIERARKEVQTNFSAPWFGDRVRETLTVTTSLVSDKVRAEHVAKGYRIQYDETDTAYYGLAVQLENRQVQIVGEVDRWWALFVAVPITRDQTMTDDGRRRPQPLDPREVVGKIAPELASAQWTADSDPTPTGDVVFRSGPLTLQAGVRAVGPLGANESYIYAIRVNSQNQQTP
ncbi:MAG: hypothetical protein HUU55_21215 [Myxococcales bacterium]|nr:hypothetical protein [Myxococcales bacterium]